MTPAEKIAALWGASEELKRITRWLRHVAATSRLRGPIDDLPSIGFKIDKLSELIGDGAHAVDT